MSYLAFLSGFHTLGMLHERRDVDIRSAFNPSENHTTADNAGSCHPRYWELRCRPRFEGGGVWGSSAWLRRIQVLDSDHDAENHCSVGLCVVPSLNPWPNVL